MKRRPIPTIGWLLAGLMTSSLVSAQTMTDPAEPVSSQEPSWKPFPAKAVLLPPKSTNVESETAAAFCTLLVLAYEHETGGRMMPPDETARALEDHETPEAVVQQANASYYVAVNLVQLETKTIITLSAYDDTGKPITRVQMSAHGADDFEEVSTRMATALAEGQTTEATRTPQTVTAQEGVKPNRVARTQRVALRMGIGVPIGTTDLSNLINGAIDVRFEGQDGFTGFGFALLIPDGSGDSAYGGLTGEVMAGYHLTDASTTPYLGGGLWGRLLSHGGNLAPYATFGVLFDRDAEANPFLELRATQNVTPLRIDGSKQYPFEPSIQGGVAW